MNRQRHQRNKSKSPSHPKRSSQSVSPENVAAQTMDKKIASADCKPVCEQDLKPALPMPQNQEQQRAAFAIEAVRARLEGADAIDRKELASHAAAFPVMIRMNGLGQAAAFY